ncbi:MAG TPA: TetR/AcrR family transcriptional regulator [Streptosporangiaceae bacterium]|jgi:AcrR family transcriptional regulator
MPSHVAAPARQKGGLPDKHRAILAGALTVFARDGYARASIDAIAEDAGVSTRTIYNHFGGKAQLFEVLILQSATRVAEAQIAIIDRYLHKVTDIEADLIEFARVWATPVPGHSDHFALVRHINADAGHIPQAAIAAWQQAGPLRVRRALADRIRQLAGQGLLRVSDPDHAARHLILLTTIFNASLPGAPRTEQEINDLVTTGVHAFLYGYAANPTAT